MLERTALIVASVTIPSTTNAAVKRHGVLALSATIGSLRGRIDQLKPVRDARDHRSGVDLTSPDTSPTPTGTLRSNWRRVKRARLKGSPEGLLSRDRQHDSRRAADGRACWACQPELARSASADYEPKRNRTLTPICAGARMGAGRIRSRRSNCLCGWGMAGAGELSPPLINRSSRQLFRMASVPAAQFSANVFRHCSDGLPRRLLQLNR